jgi:hypothetical protein
VTLRALAAALLAAVALLAGAPTGAGAQDVTDIRLVVTDLDGVVGPGAVPAGDEPPEDVDDVTVRLLVENRGGTDLDGLRIVVETWGRVDTRSEMRAALAGGDVPARANSPIDTLLRDDGTLVAGDVAGVSVTVPGDRIGFDDEAPTVHPLQVSVVRGTFVLDQVRTAVVHLPSAPVAPLQTAVVWPVDDAPWRGAGGVYPTGIDTPIRPGGRLDRIVGALEQHPETPVTLAPAAHLLEDLRDRADGYPSVTVANGGSQRYDVGPDEPSAVLANDFLRRVRAVAAAAPLPPVAGPYADVVLAGMTDRGPALAELAGTAVADGREELRSLLDRRPDQGVFLATSPLDEATLDLVPGELVVVPYTAVVAPDLATNPNVDIPYPYRRTTTPAGRVMRVLVGDPWLTRLVGEDTDTDHGPVLAAHRVVLETAMVQLRRPGTAGRPLVLLPPLDWDPPGRFAETLLTRLGDTPWLELVDASSLPAGADRAPLSVDLTGAPAALVSPIAAPLIAAEEALTSAAAALPDGGAEVDGRPREDLEQQLLRAPSVWYLAGRTDRASALIRDVQRAVDRSFGSVEVPGSARVTLTAERGTIPVTLRREGGPLTVRVTVDSAGGLAWPDGRTSPPVTLTEDGTQTVSFATRALSRGTFAVTVTVTDPTGARVLETSRLSVRSTAISGPALGITGLIVALLLLRGMLRRRPPDRPRLEVVR